MIFAVIIMTGDDVGRSRNEPESASKPRARQNVIFEFGYLLAQLKKGKVFVLHEQGVEIPSDLGGVVYITYDNGGAWKMLLAKAIRQARIPLDTSFLGV